MAMWDGKADLCHCSGGAGCVGFDCSGSMRDRWVAGEAGASERETGPAVALQAERDAEIICAVHPAEVAGLGWPQRIG
jgi:hypothetical protein